MNNFSKEIVKTFEIRKSRKQKDAFLDCVCKHLDELEYTYQIQETKGLIKNRNLIVGDVKTAKVICTAHYDTCATMFILPNFITPLNKKVYYCYQFVLSFGLIGLAFLLGILLDIITFGVISASTGYLLMLFLIFFQLMMGYRNPKNYNDNTSGVVTLLELLESVEDREKIAFVFFDNEEKGLLGSGAFRKKYASKVVDKVLLNFDCVGDGDTLLLKYNKSMHQSDVKNVLEASCVSNEHKKFIFSDKGLYPSDQKHFDKICHTVAIAALKSSKWVGLYMNRIHTPKDTCLDENNVELLKESVLAFLKKI